jgi:hypothetical protein
MRAYQHVVNSRSGGTRPHSASSRRRSGTSSGRYSQNSATRPTRPSSSNYTSQHVTKLLVTARRRAYGGSSNSNSNNYALGNSGRYGSVHRGSKKPTRQGSSSRYGGYLHQRPQSAQGGAYRLARARKQEQNSQNYQNVLQSGTQGMRIAGQRGITGTGTKFQTNYWGGTQKATNEIAHHHPLLQQQITKVSKTNNKTSISSKMHTQPYDNMNKHTSDRWNSKNGGVSNSSINKNVTSSSFKKTPSKEGSVSRTLSVSSQNNRSNPNAPLIKLTPRGSTTKSTSIKKETTTIPTAVNKTANTPKISTTKSVVVANGVADEAEIAASALIGQTTTGTSSSNSTNATGTSSPTSTGTASGATSTAATKKPPSDFAKMREANRLLAERNLKLREELELLRHQQKNKDDHDNDTTGGAAATSSSQGISKNVVQTTTSATSNQSNSNSDTVNKKSGNGGVDWWDKNYAMSGNKRPIQRPQSAGRVKSDRAGTGTGGGNAAGAYVNTLRPQRRPGSAGRTRDSSSGSGTKKLQRPTTAPGRRREDQAVAHGMSGQMVDAASEEVRLRALMNDVNWDGRGRSDMYHFGKVLGTGSFGVVRLVHHKLSGTKTAVKTYDKRKIKDSAQLKRVQQEIRLMARANHPNIVRLFETLESQHRVHLVMEYVAGGNLCQYVKLKKKLSESEARLIFQQLAHASAYLHSINVAHRDIKLENVLFVSSIVSTFIYLLLIVTENNKFVIVFFKHTGFG